MVLTGVAGLKQNGIFYANSKTRHEDILDGSSNTILIGERSAYKVSLSTWAGVIRNAELAEWRVVGWTGEPPNLPESQVPSGVHVHPYAQFNSVHPNGLTMFAFADGSVHAIESEVDFEVFFSLGTINGREKESLADIR